MAVPSFFVWFSVACPISDVYVAMDKKLDARQYLLSLQQNYHNDDDIEGMIQERLEKLK